MGKRKASTRVRRPPKPKLEKVFDCPFCNHTQTVEVLYHKDQKRASISCRVCAVSWDTSITALTEPIDVYSDWIDECAKQNA